MPVTHIRRKEPIPYGKVRVAVYALTLLLAVGVMLSGCRPYAVRNAADASSHHRSVPVGTVLVLHRELTIAPTYARVFFQNGHAGSAISEYQPHCQLEVRRVLPVTQTVQPDEFVIRKVVYDIIDVAAAPGVKLAWIMSGAGGEVSDIMMAWDMRLHSDKQPQVVKLMCGGAFDSPGRARLPSLEEMRAALGSYASLRVPE